MQIKSLTKLEKEIEWKTQSMYIYARSLALISQADILALTLTPHVESLALTLTTEAESLIQTRLIKFIVLRVEIRGNINQCMIQSAPSLDWRGVQAGWQD